LWAVDSPRAEFFRRITQRTFDVLKEILGHKILLEPDLLAVAVALEPDIVRKAETHHVKVELTGQHTRGATTVDWYDRTGQEPNVNIVLELDAERLWELLYAAVRQTVPRCSLLK
jgi:inosine-uridine nucleoside N-ribohydrolase